MRVGVAVLLLLVGVGCESRPAPPANAAVVDAGAPEPVVDAGMALDLPPPLANDESTLPREVTVDDGAVEGEELMRLLLRDPAKAVTNLAEIPTPSEWQQLLLVGLRKGKVSEPPFPVLAPANGGRVSAGATGYVARESLTFKSKPASLELPIDTPVHIDSVDGGIATVTVDVVTRVDFGLSGAEPDSVTAEKHAGQVDVKWLVPAPLDARALLAEAQAKLKADASDDAVVLARRAFLIERSERARAVLLRAAYAAHRPATVTEATFSRMLAAAPALELAWGCRGDAAKAVWSADKGPGQKLGADACLTLVDARTVCEGAQAKVKARAQAAEAWRTSSGFKEGPRLRFTVDARAPRLVLLSAATVVVRDECSDFEELRIDGSNAVLRRLPLPLGTAKTVVTVPVARYQGSEYAVLSAANELKAAAWLRARGACSWTLTAKGALEMSLGAGDHGFTAERDVTAATVLKRPDRECSCQ